MGSAEYTSHCTNATYELNQAHERTGASLCESITALAASVLIRNDNASCHCYCTMAVMGALEARRHTIGRCHIALPGRPFSSFDCQ